MIDAVVRDLVSREFGAAWQEQTVNGLELRTAVVEPYRADVSDVYRSGQSMNVWVLVKAEPNAAEGMFVAFEPNTKQFCLAEYAPDGPPYILGFHSTLRAAVEAM
jgi:hypothetical protein